MDSIEEKKSVLLFNGPVPEQKADIFEMQGTFPRIGIASIAAVLQAAGHQVRVIDPFGETPGTIIQTMKDCNPAVVGIPAFTSEIFAADTTAKLVKDFNPNIITVVGGAHASALPERTLQEFKNFDIAAFCEGENTMLDIVSGKKWSEIKGIAYREGGAVYKNPPREIINDLNSLPFPAWELYDLNKYRGGNLMDEFAKNGKALDLPVEGARGCPFDCKFCFRINGKAIRFKSPARIIEEIKRNVEKFGADTIYFVEGTYGVNKQIAHETCDELIRCGLSEKIKWSTGGRVNVLDEPLLKKMKAAGCVFLGYGVESGDQDLLNKMGKGTTIQQIYDNFDVCRKIGIKTEANFILGHIGETEASINKTIKFARKLKADYGNFAILVPFPGTAIFDMAVRGENNFQIKTYNWRLYGKQIGAAMELKHLPHQKMVALQSKAYLYFFLTPRRFKFFLRRLTPARIKGALLRLLHLG